MIFLLIIRILSHLSSIIWEQYILLNPYHGTSKDKFVCDRPKFCCLSPSTKPNQVCLYNSLNLKESPAYQDSSIIQFSSKIYKIIIFYHNRSIDLKQNEKNIN